MQILEDNKLNFKNPSDGKITLFSDKIQLDLEFKISPNKEYGTDFDVYANFSPRGFYKNTELSLDDKLSVLSIYEKFLDSTMNDKIQKFPDDMNEKLEGNSKKNMFSKFRDFWNEVKRIPSLLRDIRALHIITYVDNEALIKSTIHLDADIYNIISNKLEHKQYRKIFELHVYNMRYGRHLIQQRIKKFFESIEPAAKFVGVIMSIGYSVPWIVFEIINMQMTNSGMNALEGQPFDFMFILSNIFVDGSEIAKNYDTIIRIATQIFGIPLLILRLGPKIAMRIIRKEIF